MKSLKDMKAADLAAAYLHFLHALGEGFFD